MYRAVLFLFVVFVAILPGAITFDFEAPAYSGSTSGVVLNGQQGWYEVPGRIGSASVHVYAGNTVGLTANPTGGGQFAAGAEPSQHAINFAAAPLWQIAFDIAMVKTIADVGDRAGRISLVDAPFDFAATAVAYWNAPNTATSTWRLGYTGLGFDDPGFLPGVEWAELEQNRWYRSGMTVDFANRRVLSAWIEDPSTGDYAEHVFADLRFAGDLNPDSIRIFSVIRGTGSGWDNITLQAVPEPAAFLLLGCGLVALGAMKRRGH